jgi:hypothetical protein
MQFQQPISLTAGQLRAMLSHYGQARSGEFSHEVSFSKIPNYLFHEADGAHGNFHPRSYQAILAAPDWRARLRKGYTGGRSIPRRHDRCRSELDCANSSDALLMNIFCYPGLWERAELCRLLGVDPGCRPVFGFKPGIPLRNGRGDQTEIDMSLGRLMVEAKLTESGFQVVPEVRLLRYADIDEVFDRAELPIVNGKVHSYQLIRGVLAARHFDRPFVVLSDARRRDLQERWFQIIKAVRHCDLRSRLILLTWQEICSVLPASLQLFLQDRYGIYPE